MAESTDDLRALLAKALADTAATYGRRLGESLRYVLADTALAVFDEDAQAKLVADMMERTRIRSMEIRNGGFDMDIDAACEITAAFVAAARTMLGEAPNYSETPIEHEVKVAESPESYVYVLTVQRAEKPTPHQMRKKAEAERDEARETVDRVRHALEQIRARAGAAEYAMYESAFTDAAELLEAAMEGVGYV